VIAKGISATSLGRIEPGNGFKPLAFFVDQRNGGDLDLKNPTQKLDDIVEGSFRIAIKDMITPQSIKPA
jgi:hypothetical protein